MKLGTAKIKGLFKFIFCCWSDYVDGLLLITMNTKRPKSSTTDGTLRIYA